MDIFKRLFSFDRMITPMLIKTVFIFAVGIQALVGLGVMFTGGAGILAGLAIIIVGPIISRVIAELTILFFQMSEKLTDLEAAVAQSRGGEAGS